MLGLSEINYSVVGVGEEGAERGVELVELLPAVALIRVVAELPVGAGATAGAIASRGGGVGGRRGEVVDVVVVEVEVRPWRRRRQLAAGGEDVRLQRRDAAREGVVEELVVHAAACCQPAC